MRRRHGGAAEEGVLAAGDGGVDGAARRCHVHRAGPVAAEGGQSPRDRGGGDGHDVPGGVVGRVVGDLVVVGALVPRRGDEEHPGAFRALDGHLGKAARARVWLKNKEPGPTAGLCCFHLPRCHFGTCF